MPEPKPDPLDLDKLSLKSVWGAVSQLRTEQRTNAALNDQAHKFTGERIEKIEGALERVDRRTEEQGKTLSRMEAHVETLVKASDLQAESDARVGVAAKKADIADKKDTRRVLKRIGLKLFYALLAGAGLLCHAAVVKSCL